LLLPPGAQAGQKKAARDSPDTGVLRSMQICTGGGRRTAKHQGCLTGIEPATS
jgi:hypothetical protein